MPASHSSPLATGGTCRDGPVPGFRVDCQRLDEARIQQCTFLEAAVRSCVSATGWRCNSHIQTAGDVTRRWRCEIVCQLVRIFRVSWLGLGRSSVQIIALPWKPPSRLEIGM
jgi:hypothetical protein